MYCLMGCCTTEENFHQVVLHIPSNCTWNHALQRSLCFSSLDICQRFVFFGRFCFRICLYIMGNVIHEGPVSDGLGNQCIIVISLITASFFHKFLKKFMIRQG